MPGIFISYRRDDSQGFAGRLADDLTLALGPDRVFSDVEIPAGSDYTEVLRHAIQSSDALLVVIGRRWAAESTQGFPSRLFEPADWVRAEIEIALVQRKIVVPVLVGGVDMPAPASLPETLQPLSRLQAATLSDRHWDADLALLLQRLGSLLPGLRSAAPQDPPPQPSPAPRGPSLAVRLLRPLGGWIGRRLRQATGLLLVLLLLYAGLRLFGDPSTLRQLDAVEARLQLGWQRLLGYAGWP